MIELGVVPTHQPVVLCGGSAAALTLASVHCVTADDPVLLAMPSEHLIARTDAFEGAMQRGTALARQGYVVMFGVRPAAPEISYGYIRAGAKMNGAHPVQASFVERFVEKPDRALAEALIRDARCFRNTGMVAVRASIWIDAIGCLRKDILAACERAYRQGARNGQFPGVDGRTFAGCPPDSIGYAVLERLAAGRDVPEAVMVRLEAANALVSSSS